MSAKLRRAYEDERGHGAHFMSRVYVAVNVVPQERQAHLAVPRPLQPKRSTSSGHEAASRPVRRFGAVISVVLRLGAPTNFSSHFSDEMDSQCLGRRIRRRICRHGWRAKMPESSKCRIISGGSTASTSWFSCWNADVVDVTSPSRKAASGSSDILAGALR